MKRRPTASTRENVLMRVGMLATVIGVGAILLGYRTVALVTFRAAFVVALVFLVVTVAGGYRRTRVTRGEPKDDGQ